MMTQPDLNQTKAAITVAVADATAKQLHAASPAHSAWVSANAGTGKTQVLTSRILRLLVEGADVDKILAVTYTRAAAAEMRNRIYSVVVDWPIIAKNDLISRLQDLGIERPSEDHITCARSLFATLSDAAASLRIETIHAFCQSLLHRFPIEAGINPYFRVMDEKQAKILKMDVFEDILKTGGAPVMQALERLALVRDADKVSDIIGQITPEIMRRLNHDPEEAKKRIFTALSCQDYIDDPDGCVRKIRKTLTDLDDDKQDKLQEFAENLIEGGGETDKKKANEVKSWLALSPTDRNDALETYAKIFLTLGGTKPKKFPSKKVCEEYLDAEQFAIDEARFITNQMTKLATLDTALNSHSLMILAMASISRYQMLKNERGLKDYDDLIGEVAAMLESHGGTSWVRYKLDQGIKYLLVDEAQDTSLEQWRILSCFADDQFNATDDPEDGSPRRSLFVVGDYKQSIYSFQGANPTLFADNGEKFKNDSHRRNKPFEHIGLDTSFRTVPPILRIVDQVITDLDGIRDPIDHKASRLDNDGWVWVDEITESDQEDVDALHARKIVDTIKQFLGKCYLPSVKRMARAGDIIILLRRRERFFNCLDRALRLAGLPVSAADRITFTSEIAYHDLMALGQVMVLPEDNLTLAALLKSPLFDLDDEQLYHLAHDRGKASIFARLKENPGQDDQVAIAYDRLREYLSLAGTCGVYDFFSHVLDNPTRRAFIRRLGAPVSDILSEFIDQAGIYEKENTSSMIGFLTFMREVADTISRQIDDRDNNKIRLMTVHGAKGLESPIVILPDCLKMSAVSTADKVVKINDDDLDIPILPAKLWKIDLTPTVVRDAKEAASLAAKAEENRLLYVAMTRASDGLYVSGFKKPHRRMDEDDSWYRLIERAVREGGNETKEGRLVFGVEARPPADWSDETVIDVDSRTPTHHVPDWVDAPPPEELTPPKPLAPSSFSTPTEASSIASAERQEAIAKGTIIHRLLEILPAIDEPQRKAAADKIVAAHRGKYLSDAEAATLIASAMDILIDQQFEGLFGARSTPEAAISGVVGEHVVSGRVDRLVIEKDAVIFIDFKSGQTPENLEEIPKSYIRQMAIYAKLLRDIQPKSAIKAVLLFTESQKPFWLPQDLMNAALAEISGGNISRPS